MEKKNILIVGNGIFGQTLAKHLINLKNAGNIYLISSTNIPSDDRIKIIDLREDNINEILEFAINHNIDITIAASNKAIKADIASFFSANGQLIFAPDLECANSIIDTGAMKKLLYKLKIKTSKFGIFEKAQNAFEYLKTAKFPLVIESTEPKDERDMFACPTMSVANIAINDLFLKNYDKILIEEYYSGHRFTLWAITDGFKILPITTTANEIFSDCPDGGFLTFGSGAWIPDNKITEDIQNFVLKEVLEPIIQFFEHSQTPYLGFIGVRGILSRGEIYIEKIYPLLENRQAEIILSSIDENLINLFIDCAVGSFADDYEEIKTNSLAYLSLSLFSRHDNKEIHLPEITDENCNLIFITKYLNGKYYSHKGFLGTINSKAKTLGSAKRILKENLTEIKCDGLKYRNDIVTSS